jgi:Fe-S cluster assembly iron-binding protein IscA
MIEMADVTRDKIKEILAKNPGKYLRLVVEGDGCAGPYLRLSLDEAGANEVTARINGIDILISDEVKRHAEITRINIFLDPAGKDLL